MVGVLAVPHSSHPLEQQHTYIEQTVEHRRTAAGVAMFLSELRLPKKQAVNLDVGVIPASATRLFYGCSYR